MDDRASILAAFEREHDKRARVEAENLELRSRVSILEGQLERSAEVRRSLFEEVMHMRKTWGPLPPPFPWRMVLRSLLVVASLLALGLALGWIALNLGA